MSRFLKISLMRLSFESFYAYPTEKSIYFLGEVYTGIEWEEGGGGERMGEGGAENGRENL